MVATPGARLDGSANGAAGITLSIDASNILFSDLEAHRVVGTGQFGSVRLVRHVPTGRLYALKVTVLCFRVFGPKIGLARIKVATS